MPRAAAHRTTPGTALVTDAERGSAVAVIRSLHAAGWRVVAAATDRRAAGLRSRHAAAAVVHPDPAVDRDGTARALSAACADHGVDLVFPITDALMRICQGLQLPPGVTLASADPGTYLAVSDKWLVVERARELGVPVPDTGLATTLDEVLQIAPSLGRPVVLKPRWSVTSDPDRGLVHHEVAIVDGDADLDRASRSLGGVVDVLVQRHHPGIGIGVELLLRGGELVAAFQHRRLREHPLRGGPSALRESVELDPDLLAWSVSLLASWSWTGLAMVEFKVGPEGPALMEINGRVWGSLPLAVRAGVDFPALAAEVHRGQRPAPPPPYRVGVRSRNLRVEAMWIAEVLRGGPQPPPIVVPPRREAVVAALRLLDPRDGHDVLSWRDPLPGLADVGQVARHLVRKVRARQ